ncbi:hypothetical protein ACHAW6_002007 [Cyclotella cf. meneghiniana]
MRRHRHRYLWSKIVLFGIPLVSIRHITLNYKYIRLITASSSTGQAEGDTQNIVFPRGNSEYGNDCFEARTDTVPRSLYGKLSHPFINLGFPKIGSSSLHSFFGCAGYRSAHYRCSPTLRCAECIQQSIAARLPPLHNCILAEVYSQIDDGSHGNFPQIEYLEELVRGYPNATFLLPFRNMNHWYRSLRKWHKNDTRMDEDLMLADIPGFRSGNGRTVHEFSEWFCKHVTRVRDMVSRFPSHSLVEIDLEDNVSTRQRMSDIFDVDATCWGRANVNLELHPELRSENMVNVGGQSKWFILGNRMIKGKDGTMRKRNYPGQPFPLYP